jgi:aldehyde dehydrogenase (NAD+)
MTTNGTSSFVQTKLFINNEVFTPPYTHWLFIKCHPELTNIQYVDAKSGETLSVYNPDDESLVAEGIQVASEADVDAAVDAAEAAFKGPWSKWTGAQRAVVMQKMADLIEKHANDIAPLETKAMGMPLNVALFCIKLSADIFRCKWRVGTDI